MVLRHVILQLNRRQPHLIIKSLLEPPFTLFAGQFDIDVLWLVFVRMIQKIEVDVFIVIDGLDECLRNIRLAVHEKDADPTVQFLTRLCDFMGTVQVDASTKSQPRSKTSICFTSRPQKQIEDAIGVRNIVIDINPADVQRRVVQVIESEIVRLVHEEKLPADLEKLVTEDLLGKANLTSDSAFQWASTAIERLQISKGTTVEKLESIRPGMFTVYSEVLRQLGENSAVAALAEDVFRMLVFTQEDLKIQEIASAIAIEPFPATEDAPGSTLEEPLRALIGSCRGLITISADDTVKFPHESVRDFFLQAPENRDSNFNYSDKRKGHLFLAKFCVRYLLFFLTQRVSAEELRTHNDNGLSALFTKCSFFAYAVAWWPVHVSLSGPLPDDLVKLLDALLRSEDGEYRLAIGCLYASKVEKFDWALLPTPSFFLASENLIHVLEIAPLDNGSDLRPSGSRVCGCFRICCKPQNAFPSSHRLSFRVNVLETDPDGFTLLHVAARDGSLAVVKYLLDHGAKGHTLSKSQLTPFSLAVEEQHNAVAEVLIRRKAAFERTYDPSQVTSLHMASLHNMGSVVEFLLAKLKVDVDIRALKDGWTALQVAAQAGHPETVSLLIANGANVTATKSANKTALYLAAGKGHLDVCQTLFANAKTDLNSNVETDKGETPLYAAAAGGYLDVVEYLLSKGAKMVTGQIDGYTELHIAAENGHLPVVRRLLNEENVKQGSKWSSHPIHCASFGGHVDVVKELVKHKADPEAKMRDVNNPDSEDYCITPFQIATRNNHQPLILALLDYNVEVKHLKSSLGYTPLHDAALTGNLDLVRLLIETYHLEPFTPSVKGITPFQLAASAGHVAVMEYLWGLPTRGSYDIDTKDSYGLNAILEALNNSHKAAVEFCLRNGSKASQVDASGRTSVRVLCDAQNGEDALEILELLIAHGVSVNERDWQGGTALHGAAFFGREKQVEFLLEHGADKDVQASLGITPLHEAAAMRKENAFALLLRYGANPLLLADTGLTCLDLAWNYQPIMSLPGLARFRDGYQPLDKAMRRAHVEKALRNWLDMNVTFHANSDRPVLELEWANTLGGLLKDLGRETEARIAFEHCVVRNAFNNPYHRLRCDVCYECKVGTYYVCRECLGSFGVCQSCHEKQIEGQLSDVCPATHTYFEVGGELWKALRRDTVNMEGWTFKRWVENLRKEYNVSDLKEPQALLCAQHPSKEASSSEQP